MYIHNYCYNFTGSDYSGPRSASIRAGETEVVITISTREDSKLEEQHKTFCITVKHPAGDSTTCITIVDDDGT